MLEKGRRKLGSGYARQKLAVLSFRSGTTGLSKGVILAHYASVSNLQRISVFDNFISNPSDPNAYYRPGKDASLRCLPFYHIHAIVLGLPRIFFSGVTNVIIPKVKGIEALAKTILQYRVTSWSTKTLMTPARLACLMSAAVRFSSSSLLSANDPSRECTR